MTVTDEQLVRERLAELRGIATPTDEIWSTITDLASTGAVSSQPPGHHRGRWLVAAAVIVLLAGGATVLAGRGQPDRAPLRTVGAESTTSTKVGAASVELVGTVDVTQQEGGAVQICSSPLFDAECVGPEIRGWSWDVVGGGTTGPSGERTGTYTITGHFDGEVFVLAAASVPEHGSDPEAAISPPCAARASDPAKNNQAAFDAMLATAAELPGYAGEWFSRDDDASPTPFDPAAGTETIAAAGDVEEVRSQLAAIWGGRLCVLQVRSSLAELQAVQARLDDFAEANGIEMTGISIDPQANVVQVGVLVADAEAQAAADAEFGPGVVAIVGRLAPT